VGIKRRSEPVIAVGGGVLLDLVGLSASLYARGVPWLRIPTTLVGLIDAGIGIKTAVNFGRRKHKLGTYHAGDTILDRTLMATVSRRQVSNGLAEALKMALIKSRALFELLEEHGRLVLEERLQGSTEVGDRAALRVLDLAVDGMLVELADNLWEEELARCVDYGHTWSPGLEMAALHAGSGNAGEPGLLHGEAVALDMALCTVVAWRRGLVNEDERDRVLRVMRSLGLATWDPLLVDEEVLAGGLLGALEHRDGYQRQPLGRGIGDHVFAGMPGSEGVEAIGWVELVAAAEVLRMLSEEG
jgi:3-dehydroquinate synthase